MPLYSIIKRMHIIAKNMHKEVIIGLIRGRYSSESSAKKEKLNIISSLKECCRIAENNNVMLVFEPINSFEIDSYNTISEAVNLINEISKVNPNCAVVIIAGSSVEMDNWINNVPSVLMGWYSGEQMGYAMYDILFGDVNPSGKLPVTFPKTYNDYPEGFYSTTKQINYDEGIYVGYRYFDHHGKEVLFPFGHGLSYTTFQYNAIQSTVSDSLNKLKVEVKISITNTGPVAGEEVVQLYVHDVECSVIRPVKQLQCFERITLSPGEKKNVSFTLESKQLAFWDEVKTHEFLVEPGMFDIMLGSSSVDIA